MIDSEEPVANLQYWLDFKSKNNDPDNDIVPVETSI
jgi:hypothetical protein